MGLQSAVAQRTRRSEKVTGRNSLPMAKAVSFQLEHKNGSMISAGTKGGFTTTTTTKLATDGPKIATPAEWFPGQKLLMRFSAVALGKG